MSVQNTFLQNSTTNCSDISTGDTGFVLLNSVFLLLMLPGFSFFYSGLTHPGSSVTMLLYPFFSIVVVSLQWWIVGYSLAFSKTSSPFIGDFSNVFLRGMLGCSYPDAPRVPELVFSLYQCITAMIPSAVILGTLAERGSVFSAIIFLFLWNTFVYDFVCTWTLNPRGWSYRMGVIDYGGGSPVHVPAGMTALAYSIFLGPPLRHTTHLSRPYAANQVILGTVLIWIANFGNLSGAGMSANMQSICATFAVTLAGSTGAITWCAMDYVSYRKTTVLGFCSGVLSSLAAIPPCAGTASPASTASLGMISALACNLVSRLKEKCHFNDVMDVFVLHGVSGAVGSIFAGVFTQKAYGGEENSGWLDGNWVQVPIQLVDLIATASWSFGVSFIILLLFSKIQFLKLRVSSDIELQGLDESEVTAASFEMEVLNVLKIEKSKY